MKEPNLTYFLEDYQRIEELEELELDYWIRKYPYVHQLYLIKALRLKSKGRLSYDKLEELAPHVDDREQLREIYFKSWDEIVEGWKGGKVEEESTGVREYGSAETVSEEQTISSDFSQGDEDISEEAREIGSEEPDTGRWTPDAVLSEFKLSDFTSWLLERGKVEGWKSGKVEEEDEESVPREELRRKKRKKRIEKLVEESVIMDEDITSETLADLLAKQGHIDEAREMYQRLRLKYPEKSAYFARKINEL